MMEPPDALMRWARRTDDAEREWARCAVDDWARARSFSQPLNWGEAEATILERDYPPLPGTFLLRVVGAVGWGVVVVLALPLFGASLAGLVLIAVSAGRDSDDDALLRLARLAFGIGIFTTGTLLAAWWQTRRRSAVGMATAGTTAIASGAAYGLTVLSDLPGVPWLTILMLGAASVGVVGLVLELASEPEGGAKRKKPPRRGPRASAKRDRAQKARDRLLEILIHRGLVDLDEGDRIRVREMPLGYWSELDGLDEREWRRVLEHRHVGWREFDESDKQVH